MTNELKPVDERPSLEQMVCDSTGMVTARARMEPSDRIRGGRVQPLLARNRDSRQQGLPHEFMTESERTFRAFGAGDDDLHLLGLFDNAKQFVNIDPADFGQKLKTEIATDYRRSCQYQFLVFAQALETAPDYQPYVLRNFDFLGGDVGPELAGRIEHLSLLD